MENVEESSTQAAKGRSKCVSIKVVVPKVSASQHHDGVGGESEADSRVEAGAQFVRASDAAHESHARRLVQDATARD